MSQEEVDQCWQNLAEKLRLEVLDKYKIEDRKERPLKADGGAQRTVWENLSSEQVQGRRMQQKRLSEVEVLLWSGGGCAKARSTE